jgi:serine/threonine protein kinase
MATVWRARHLRLHTDVAVKVLREVTPAAEERFRREARYAARLRHRNVIEVLDSGAHGRVPYLVMELIEGISVAERLEHGVPPLFEVIDIVDQVLAGLSRVHEERLIHRDVKPDNVLLCSGLAKLVDFGLCKPVHQVTVEGPPSIVGTPHYMSPEQTQSSIDLDPRTDVFSAGAMAYELLTGETPFETTSTQFGPLERIRRLDMVPLSIARPDLGPEFEEVVSVALSREREARFANATEMRDAWRTATRAWAARLMTEGDADANLATCLVLYLEGRGNPPNELRHRWASWSRSQASLTPRRHRESAETRVAPRAASRGRDQSYTREAERHCGEQSRVASSAKRAVTGHWVSGRNAAIAVCAFVVTVAVALTLGRPVAGNTHRSKHGREKLETREASADEETTNDAARSVPSSPAAPVTLDDGPPSTTAEGVVSPRRPLIDRSGSRSEPVQGRGAAHPVEDRSPTASGTSMRVAVERPSATGRDIVSAPTDHEDRAARPSGSRTRTKRNSRSRFYSDPGF